MEKNIKKECIDVYWIYIYTFLYSRSEYIVSEPYVNENFF